MMTALSSEDQRARGESLGANRYLVKSQVGIEDVVRTVHDVLADTPAAAAPSASQLFGAPASSATVSNPQTFSLPPRPMPGPAAAPATPAAAPVRQPSMMPQPTAPFSTSAPASLGASIVNPTQQVAPAPVAPAPVINMSQPFTPPQPVAAPAPMPAPAPIITAPVIDTTPQPAPTYSPAPAAAATPFQDVIAPQPSASPAPDMASLIAQELNQDNQAPQNPVQ